jgi:hypothetical protein
MKTMKLAAAAALLCIISTAASAADYQYLNGKVDSHWRSDLLAWLAKNKPDPTNVSIGITPDGDVHAYAVPGQFTGIYSIQRLHHPSDRANAAFRAMVDGGIGRIIGFGPRKHAGERPPSPPSNPASNQPTDQPSGPQDDGPAPPAEGQGEQGPAQGGSAAKFDVYILSWTKQ